MTTNKLKARPFQPKAYAIEDSVFAGRHHRHLRVPDGVTIPDQRAIAHRLADHFGIPAPVVIRRRGRPDIASSARPADNTITMGALAGPAIVCHEVAHLLADARVTGEPWHGRTWAHYYVEAVGVILGDFHARRLGSAFDAHSTTASR